MNERPRKLTSAARWVALVLSAGAISTYAGDTRPDSATAQQARSQGDTAPTTEPAGDHAVRHHRPTDEEWREAEEALKSMSPKRLAAVQGLKEGPAKQRMRTYIFNRYLTLKKLQENFPKLYEVQTERIKIEDDLYDLHQKFGPANAVQKGVLRAQMRADIVQLFDNTQRDRQVRIERFTEWARELEAKRVEDEQDRDTVINWQLQQVLVRGPSQLDREGMPRRGGYYGSRPSVPPPGASVTQPFTEPPEK